MAPALFNSTRRPINNVQEILKQLHFPKAQAIALGISELSQEQPSALFSVVFL